jgi:hypothetical protein
VVGALDAGQRKGELARGFVNLFQSSTPFAARPVEASGSITRMATSAAHNASSSFCFLCMPPFSRTRGSRGTPYPTRGAETVVRDAMQPTHVSIWPEY